MNGGLAKYFFLEYMKKKELYHKKNPMGRCKVVKNYPQQKITSIHIVGNSAKTPYKSSIIL
jgi:hypothetical protein